MTLLTNQFRAADAFEYANVYQTAVLQEPEDIRRRLRSMNERVADHPQAVSDVWLAGYRALEDALLFVEQRKLPEVVKLNDSVRDVFVTEL